MKLLTNCDADYGRRVVEGLQNASDNIQAGPIGSKRSRKLWKWLKKNHVNQNLTKAVA